VLADRVERLCGSVPLWLIAINPTTEIAGRSS